jgi:hypothetical protein
LAGQKLLPIAIILSLLGGLIFTSSLAFAYWQELNVVTNVVVVFDGEDAELEIVQTNPEFSGKLVPEGRAKFEYEVEEVLFSFNVQLDQTLVRTMNLIVEAVDIKIGDSTEYAHLVDITIGNQKNLMEYELFNDIVLVNVVVRLLEPIDMDEAIALGLDLDLVNVSDSKLAFNTINGETITFGIKFSVDLRDVE